VSNPLDLARNLLGTWHVAGRV